MTDERISKEKDPKVRALMRSEAFSALPRRKRVVAKGKYKGKSIDDLSLDINGNFTFLLDGDLKRIVNPPLLVPDANGDIVQTYTVGVGPDTKTVTSKYRYDPEKALRDIVEDLGSTTVVFASTTDYWMEESSTTYSTARAGTTADVHSASDVVLQIGQAFFTPNYYCLEGFIPFDTSAIDDTDTIDDAVLSIYGQTNNTVTDCNILAASLDFGIPGALSDWQDGTELAALTPLGSLATSGFSTAAYNDLTNTGAGIKSVVNVTGTTKLFLWSDRQEAGTTPTNAEYIIIHSGDASGTTNDPKLTITHTAAAGGSDATQIMGWGLF